MAAAVGRAFSLPAQSCAQLHGVRFVTVRAGGPVNKTVEMNVWCGFVLNGMERMLKV
jgi:hypothetical protein